MAHHSPPRHMKPLESEVVRDAPLLHQAPVVQEEALASHKKHHHKAAAAEEDHKADHEEDDDVPPPPAKKPARLTAEALAKLEAETTQKKAPHRNDVSTSRGPRTTRRPRRASWKC